MATNDETQTVWERLAAPFERAEELHREGPGGLKLTYVNAQTVEGRLDSVVGAENWSTEYEVLHWTPVVVECRLTIQDKNGEPITKANVGEGDGEDEAAKSAYSDAFKRAARTFGVGRYLGKKEDAQPRQERAQPAQQRPTSTRGTLTTPSAFWTKAKRDHQLAPDQVCELLNITIDDIKDSTPAQLASAFADLGARVAEKARA